jgi:hypothetical protein
VPTSTLKSFVNRPARAWTAEKHKAARQAMRVNLIGGCFIVDRFERGSPFVKGQNFAETGDSAPSLVTCCRGSLWPCYSTSSLSKSALSGKCARGNKFLQIRARNSAAHCRRCGSRRDSIHLCSSPITISLKRCSTMPFRWPAARGGFVGSSFSVGLAPTPRW